MKNPIQTLHTFITSQMKSTSTLIRIIAFIFIDLLLILLFAPFGLIDLWFFDKDRVVSDRENLIILIHGTGVSDWQWSIVRLYLRFFDRQYISVRYDSHQHIMKSCLSVLTQIPKDVDLTLIGHSQGGLIALYLHKYLLKGVKETFLLNTPQRGASIINWLYNGDSLSDSVKDMRPKSEFIKSLQDIKLMGNIHEVMGLNDYVRKDECVVHHEDVYLSYFGHYFSAVNPYLWLTCIIPSPQAAGRA
jgi:pimeloyl-ACP methyl ester carboxylesterase